jgi:hypothetical protein
MHRLTFADWFSADAKVPLQTCMSMLRLSEEVFGGTGIGFAVVDRVISCLEETSGQRAKRDR